MKTDNIKQIEKTIKADTQQQIKELLLFLIKNDEAKAIRENENYIYYVTTKGEVYSYNKNNKSIKRLQQYLRDKYLAVKTINRKIEYVHRLVGEAFLKDFKSHLQINHIDKNTSNNQLSNLEICTHKQNNYHRAVTNRVDWIVSISEIRTAQDVLQSDDINDVVKAIDFHKIMTHFIEDFEIMKVE